MRIEEVGSLPGPEMGVLGDLWVAAWTPVFPAIDFVARRPWFAGYMADLLAGGVRLLVARAADGRIAGFLTLDRETGTIDQLAVDPSLGRQGVASRLMAEAKRRRPAGLSLSVNAANAGALAFYARQGLAVTGRGVSPRSGLPTFTMAWPPPFPSSSSEEGNA